MSDRSREGSIKPSGQLNLTIIKNTPPYATDLRTIIAHSSPQKGLPEEVNDWRSDNLKQNFSRSIKAFLGSRAARRLGVVPVYGALWLRKIHRPTGNILDLGLASLRVVTDTGVGYIVDAFQNTVEPENMKYHGFGTGTNAEAVGNTALQTELSTQYNPDNTRPTGSTTESAANTYRTVATFTPDAGGTIAVTEHGIFSQAATGGGVLLDRSVFSAVNVVAGTDSLQTTYDLTFPSGG